MEPVYTVIYSGANNSQSPSVKIKECVSVSPEKVAKPSVILFPNPAQREVNFEVQNADKVTDIQMVDLSGKQVLFEKDQTMVSKGKINVSSLRKGCYIVSFRMGDKTLFKRLLID